MKSSYYFFIAVVIIGIATFVVVKKNNTSQNHRKEVRKQMPQKVILGTWILEGESNNLRVFTPDGHVKIIINGVMQSDDTFSISDTCNGTTNADGTLFLNTIDGEDATEYCELINGINVNNSNVLSLMTDNGQLLVYHKP